MVVYVPYWDRLGTSASIVVRTVANPADLALSLRSEIWFLDNQVPVSNIQTMEQLVTGSVSQRRFQVWLFLLFAFFSVFLASLGIYGVVAESVTRRTKEIGIRMALGATPSDISAQVFRQSIVSVAVGILIGIVMSLYVGRLLSSLLYEVSSSDITTLGGSALVLILVAMAASYMPARRASRVDPVAALRSE